MAGWKRRRLHPTEINFKRSSFYFPRGWEANGVRTPWVFRNNGWPGTQKFSFRDVSVRAFDGVSPGIARRHNVCFVDDDLALRGWARQ